MIWQRNLCIGFLFLFSIFVGANGFWGGDIASIIFFPFYYVAIYAEIKFSRVFLGNILSRKALSQKTLFLTFQALFMRKKILNSQLRLISDGRYFV